MKTEGKITRPFKDDLNQIPYDFTVEVTTSFKGSDLIECLENYGQRFYEMVQEAVTKSIPKKKKCKKAKWLSERALQNPADED